MMAEDRARVNELIEIFGYPYDEDIGVNGTYPGGYDGPDIYNYFLIERTDLTDKEARCGELTRDGRMPGDDRDGVGRVPARWSAWVITWRRCEDSKAPKVCEDGVNEPTELGVKYEVGIGLDAGRGVYLP